MDIMSRKGPEDCLIVRAESTPANLRRRAAQDMERAKKLDEAGDPAAAQEHRNQAFVKYAIAWGLVAALAAATTAEGREFYGDVGEKLGLWQGS